MPCLVLPCHVMAIYTILVVALPNPGGQADLQVHGIDRWRHAHVVVVLLFVPALALLLLRISFALQFRRIKRRSPHRYNCMIN